MKRAVRRVDPHSSAFVKAASTTTTAAVASVVAAIVVDSGLVFGVGSTDGDRSNGADRPAVPASVGDHHHHLAGEAMVDHPRHIAVGEASEGVAADSGAGPRVAPRWATAAALRHHRRDPRCAGA